ncbi:MAG TPA: glycosyltransferase family 1 protein [Chloroflexi bacterium]|nr:glycosyltransferase family 1 protein [Chloroflexota bacterium]
MRVALVGDEYYPDIGGAAHYAFDLSLQLGKLGIDVMVVTHAHPGQPEEEEIAGVKIKRVKGLVLHNPHRAVSPLLFRHCHEYILDGKFDVVHGLDVYSSMAQMVIPFAHRHRIPCVTTCHTVIASHFSILLQRPLGLVLKRTGRLIAVSQASAHFCRLLGCPEEKITVVPNGGDPACFNGEIDVLAMREELGIGAEPLVVTASRLIKRKNPKLLVSAFARVLEVVPDAKLAIAGSGRQKDNLSRQIKDLNIVNSVFMLGVLAKEKVAQLMAAAEVFVLPSKLESFGLSLLEASAAGVPIVCSNAGGVPEIFKDGFNALLYPPGDEDAMAKAIICLIQDRELAEKISANARETAGRFTWDLAAQRTLRVYEEVLQESGSSCSHQ